MRRRELRFAREAGDDLVRLYMFLAERDVAAATDALETIREALDMVCAFPHSCRRIEGGGGLRECVISFGRSGYVAAFEVTDDEVTVLAVRHQREDDLF